MEDLRKEPRTHLVYYLRVFNQENQALFGHVVDVSRHGMLITSDKPMNADAKYRLAIENTDRMKRPESLEFEAECRWCKEDTDAGLYDGGFRLLAASNQLEKMITKFI